MTDRSVEANEQFDRVSIDRHACHSMDNGIAPLDGLGKRVERDRPEHNGKDEPKKVRGHDRLHRG